MKHWQLAAMGGHELARHNLGVEEDRAGNAERALKHWKISAASGLRGSLGTIILFYQQGRATKDDYEMTLHAYNKHQKDIHSYQRDEAATNKGESAPRQTLAR